MYKILIIEDEEQIASTISEYLEKHDFICKKIDDFKNIMQLFEDFNPHLVIMDINLPYFDGYHWCKKIRQQSTCPIIILSSRMTELDQVYGIENGADDFITKPFSISVLKAKINAQLRRSYGQYVEDLDIQILQVGNTTLDASKATIQTAQGRESLTLRELLLAKALFTSPDKILSRDKLFSLLWDTDEFIAENTLTVNIGRLRKKLDSISSNIEIKSIRRLGYHIEEKEL